jgi:hypothetical protein
MNDLIQRLDAILKPINEAVQGINRAQMVRYVAIYMLIAGVFSLCGGAALMGVGALGGLGGAVGAIGIDAASETGGVTQEDVSEANQALSGLAGASAFAIVMGLLSIVAAPLLLVGALGLFQRKHWGRTLAMLAFAVNAIASLLGMFTGGALLNLVWVLVSAYLVYFFYRDEALKREFS